MFNGPGKLEDGVVEIPILSVMLTITKNSIIDGRKHDKLGRRLIVRVTKRTHAVRLMRMFNRK